MQRGLFIRRLLFSLCIVSLCGILPLPVSAEGKNAEIARGKPVTAYPSWMW